MNASKDTENGAWQIPPVFANADHRRSLSREDHEHDETADERNAKPYKQERNSTNDVSHVFIPTYRGQKRAITDIGEPDTRLSARFPFFSLT
jgi:hypothetical protein